MWALRPRNATQSLSSKLEPFLDGLYLDEVDGAVVGEIIDGRIAEGVSNATIKRDLVALSSVLKFARARKWRPDNPARDHMALVKERHEPMVLPNPDDIRHVIAAAPGMIAARNQAARGDGSVSTNETELSTVGVSKQVVLARQSIAERASYPNSFARAPHKSKCTKRAYCCALCGLSAYSFRDLFRAGVCEFFDRR